MTDTHRQAGASKGLKKSKTDTELVEIHRRFLQIGRKLIEVRMRNQHVAKNLNSIQSDGGSGN